MILINISNEKIIQENDMTRINVQAIVTAGSETITSIEIDPNNSTNFFDITSDEYLDWMYSIAADTTINIKVTDSTLAETFKTATIKVVSILEDNLFSEDSDIIPYEPDLLGYLQKGRLTYLDKHRLAQEEILNELDANQIWKQDGTRYVAADIIDIKEFKEWSKFVTLRIIFEGMHNAVDDIFTDKASMYQGRAVQAKKRASLRLDSNGDGVINEASEKTDLISGDLVRG